MHSMARAILEEFMALAVSTVPSRASGLGSVPCQATMMEMVMVMMLVVMNELGCSLEAATWNDVFAPLFILEGSRCLHVLPSSVW